MTRIILLYSRTSSVSVEWLRRTNPSRQKPTINISFHHLRHKTKIGYQSIRVKVERIQWRFLEDGSRYVLSSSWPKKRLVCVRALASSHLSLHFDNNNGLKHFHYYSFIMSALQLHIITLVNELSVFYRHNLTTETSAVIITINLGCFAANF